PISSCALYCSASVPHRPLPSFPTRRSSDLTPARVLHGVPGRGPWGTNDRDPQPGGAGGHGAAHAGFGARRRVATTLVWPSRRSRSEEHTSELQSRENLVCRLLLEKKKPVSE